MRHFDNMDDTLPRVKKKKRKTRLGSIKTLIHGRLLLYGTVKKGRGWQDSSSCGGDLFMFMWILCRSTGSHLVSPSPLVTAPLVPGPLCTFVRWSGWYRTGHWNIAPNPEGEAGSWGACESLSVFFYGRRSVHSVGHAHRVRGLAYAAVFMAPQTHSALPHGICLAGCVCAHGCVCEHYEGWGAEVPLCPAPGFVSPFPAWGGGFRGNGFEFQANLGPEREQGVGERGGSQQRFQELLEVVMLQARELHVSKYRPKQDRWWSANAGERLNFTRKNLLASQGI